jgi:hypothetical protein
MAITNFVSRIGRPFVNHADRLSGSVLLVVAIFAWLEAIHLPFGSVHQPDAGFFPQVLSVLLFLTSATIIAHSFMKEVDVAEFSRRSWLVPIAAGVLIGYALVLPTVGYVLTTTIVMLLIMRGLSKMAWLRALLYSVPTVVLSYLAFVKLGVPLPPGPLPF